jgi:hypothetical protein
MQMWILYYFAHILRLWSEDITVLCRGVDGWALLLRESVCEPWEDDIRQGHLAHSRSHHPSKFNNSLHVLFCDWTSTLHFIWSAKNFRGSPDFPMISLYILTQTCLWWPSVDSLWPQTSSPFCYTQTAQGKSLSITNLNFHWSWLTWCLLGKFLSDQNGGDKHGGFGVNNRKLGMGQFFWSTESLIQKSSTFTVNIIFWNGFWPWYTVILMS